MNRCDKCDNDFPYAEAPTNGQPFRCFGCRSMYAWANDVKDSKCNISSSKEIDQSIGPLYHKNRPLKVGDIVRRYGASAQDGFTQLEVTKIFKTGFEARNAITTYNPEWVHCIAMGHYNIFYCHADGCLISQP